MSTIRWLHNNTKYLPNFIDENLNIVPRNLYQIIICTSPTFWLKSCHKATLLTVCLVASRPLIMFYGSSVSLAALNMLVYSWLGIKFMPLVTTTFKGSMKEHRNHLG